MFLAVLAIVRPDQAHAQACGPTTTIAGTEFVTCTAAGNTYPSGIEYLGLGTDAVDVTLNPDVVIVDPAPGAGVSAFGTGSTVVTDNGATIDMTPPMATDNMAGISVITNEGDATINSKGSINVTVGQFSYALISETRNASSNGLASVVYDGPGITMTAGNSSIIVFAYATDLGSAFASVTGNINGMQSPGSSSLGAIYAYSTSDNAEVQYHGGTISLQGVGAYGIATTGVGDASVARVTTDPRTSINITSDGGQALGISARTYGSASDGAAATINAASAIDITVPTSAATPPATAIGIRGLALADASVAASYSGPGIAIDGSGVTPPVASGATPFPDSGDGILALSASGTVGVTSSGPITTTGPGVFGILADSGTVANEDFNFTPAGAGSDVTVTTTAPISTQGAEAHGIWASTSTGTATVNAGSVSTTGEYSTAIEASGGAGVTVTVAQGATISGGWQPDPASVGPVYGLAASGVHMQSSGGATLLTNNGTIGALSDRALYGDPHVINNGTIIGYVNFDPGANVVDNNGIFDMRNFADTDGDGVRDWRGVAISDFGAATGGGPGGIFNNNGLVRPLQVSGAAITDATGEYVPTTGPDSRALEASVYTLEGNPAITQSEFVNVARFTNSGAINLQNGVAGDVFVITGNAEAGGPPGSGVFVSNGGSLLVDAYLNAGIPPGGETNSISDVLVVDSTQTAGGPTRLFVSKTGTTSELTTGNGIEVVEVRDKSAGGSVPNAFALGGTVVGGAYEYALYHNGVGGDASDGNWYLRDVTPDDKPIYSASVQTTLPFADVLSDLSNATLGTLEQRTGNRVASNASAQKSGSCSDRDPDYRWPWDFDERCIDDDETKIISGPGAWGRIVGQYSSYDPKVGSPYTQGIGFLEAGYEGAALESGTGDLTLGFYGNVGFANAHIKLTPDPTTGARRKGEIDSTGYGLGANVTWLGSDGFYADATGQLTWYDSSLSNKPTGHDEAWAGAVGLEVGQRLPLGAGWALVPQAQLTFTDVDFNSFIDIYGARNSLGDGNSLRGSAGVRLENVISWKDADGELRRLQLYGVTNFFEEFLGGTSIDAAGVSVVQSREDTWGEFGLGGTYGWGAAWSVYGEADYTTALSSRGGDENFSLKGTAGLRYTW